MVDNNKLERLVNNLVATKAVVEVVILVMVNPINEEQKGNTSAGREDTDEASKICQGREVAWMKTSSTSQVCLVLQVLHLSQIAGS